MKAFGGKLVVTLQATDVAGDIKLDVEGKGLETGSINIKTRK